MSTQTTISQYFANRKRRAVDEIKSNNQDRKLLIPDVVSSNDLPTKEFRDDETLVLKRKISWDSDSEVPRKKVVTPGHYNPKRTPKFTTLRTSVKKSRAKSIEKSAVRKSLFAESDLLKKQTKLSFGSDYTSADSPTDPVPLDSSPSSPDESDVKVEPVSVSEQQDLTTPCELVTSDKPVTPVESVPVSDQVVPISPVNVKASTEDNSDASALESEPCPSTSKQSLREELGLTDIKSKLKGSSRLDQIRNAIKRIDKGYEKLAEIQAKKDKFPTLSKFDSIEIEVPCSPVKSPLKIEPFRLPKPSPSKLREAVFRSPCKLPPPQRPYVSPRKLLDEMRPRDGLSLTKSGYDRYCSFAAQAGKPCLPLPLSYRILGEIFKAVEAILSIMHNRKELAYFSKLKPSVRELAKKNLSEHHLSQILRVFPEAFQLSYEKVKEVGKPIRYELTVRPNVPSNDNESSKEQTVPSSMLERQRYFYKQLLDLVKTHHEKFLLSLDPPLIVDKDKLSRWHPDFNIDSCPDIEPAEMPKPPTVETITSAKQLLGKAKEMFVINPRMEKALEKLSHCDNTSNTDGKPTAASVVPSWTNAIKGIPKSLLEKVRAKQAAKAVEMLTRDPQLLKQDIEISRLPEMARILRNLFVVSRKNVMMKKHILSKLESSFREHLSSREMDHHLTLLVDKTHPWLTTTKDGHVTYVRMDKSMEMTLVYNKINQSSTNSAPNS